MFHWKTYLLHSQHQRKTTIKIQCWCNEAQQKCTEDTWATGKTKEEKGRGKSNKVLKHP